MKNYRYYSVITGIFSACLIISNVLDSKIFAFSFLALPTGIIIFPITYLFGDVLTEVYGYANSRKVIWTGFFSILILIATLYIAQILPSHPIWKNQLAFEQILGKVPRIAIASIVAYLFGEFANSFTLSKMKVNFEGKKITLRFVCSTFVGQAVDTFVFVIIAFVGTFGFADMFEIILSAWLFKVCWEIIALPITIPIVKWLKKVENEDYFDKDTNYNPFLRK